MNPASTNKSIEKIYFEAKKNGALGGKILGAGKSGYLLVYANSNYHSNLRKKLKKLNSKIKFERVNFSLDGLKYWKVY